MKPRELKDEKREIEIGRHPVIGSYVYKAKDLFPYPVTLQIACKELRLLLCYCALRISDSRKFCSEKNLLWMDTMTLSVGHI